MGQNIILTGEGVTQFNSAIELLNSSILNFAHLTNHMIPEKLITSGLTEYMKEFFNIIEIEHKVETSYTCQGICKRLDESIEADIFRCFRSLVFLILTSAKPANMVAILTQSEKDIMFSLQDNGFQVFTRKQIEVSQFDLGKFQANMAKVNGSLKTESSESGNYTEITIPLNG